MEGLKARTPGETEFHQAVLEVIESVWDAYDANPRYKQAKILERMVEPEYNPNVALEVGFMLAFKRPCLILKESSLPKLYSDLIGITYFEFDSTKVDETLGRAIEEWLQKLGHDSAITISANEFDSPADANKERARRIIAELKTLAANKKIPDVDRVIRQEASLSSLAISDNERGRPDDDIDLLVEERDTMKKLLADGVTLRLILSPNLVEETAELGLFDKEYMETDVLPRFDLLISTIRENLTNPNLQIVCTHRLPHQNLLIVGTRRVFRGRKRLREKGFSHTTLIFDPAVVQADISEFDDLFADITNAELDIQEPSVEDYGSQELKVIIIKRLKKSRKAVKRKCAKNRNSL